MSIATALERQTAGLRPIPCDGAIRARTHKEVSGFSRRLGRVEWEKNIAAMPQTRAV